MGYIFSKILSMQNYCFKKECFITIIGPEGSGKSSLINKLRKDMGLPILPPHIGMSQKVKYNRFNLEIIFLFNKGKTMALWKYYIDKIDAIILVLDSSNIESIKESADIFWDYFAKSDKNFPILIYANRLNLEGALTLDDISFIFNLKNLNKKQEKIIGNENYNSDEIYKGLDWLDTLL